MIPIKTSEAIASMKEGGSRLGTILQSLLTMSRPGVSLLHIEEEAQKAIKETGGVPSFPTVEHYQYATCLCVNDEVVHGLPRPYVLQHGDIFTIDIGMIYEGYHVDTASTILVGTDKSEDAKIKERFVQCGEETLWNAIAVARPGNRVGHISSAIQEGIEKAGYHVVKDLTGHGVGKALHEEPMIPGYLHGSIERTPLLTSGMTLAIEVIYAMGKGSIVYAGDDGWTLASRDMSLTATFEHSIAITDAKTVVLTKSKN